MIEVNLLPGGKKRQARGPRFSLPRPSLKGGSSSVNSWVMAAGIVFLVSAGAMGWLFFGTRSRTETLTVAIEDAARDSARFADLIQQTEGLRARRDSIGQKVSIIQEIDGNRYVWPHVMDEVARALPDYTWLTAILQVTGGDNLQFRIEGRAGNNFALTRFMENLEASPFVREVTLVTTEQIVERGADGGERQVHQFTLDATYEDPPSELIETVPLFASSNAPALIP